MVVTSSAFCRIADKYEQIEITVNRTAIEIDDTSNIDESALATVISCLV